MAQKKLVRFEAIKHFPNVLQRPPEMAGRWTAFFNNHQPIVLELACGKGEYTVALAGSHPENNYIGVDIKGNRLYVGAKHCLAAGITNAAFLRAPIDQIATFFGPNEIAEIWITFPDPQLRFSKARKRLTHPAFLRRYQQILKPGGLIHLKTDSPRLYHFTKQALSAYKLEVLTDYEDLAAVPEPDPALLIKTHYEGLDIAGSNRIHYLKFALPAEPLPDIDESFTEDLRQHEPVAGGH